MGYVLWSRRSHKLGTWCGYRSIIRIVVHCFQVHCNGRLSSCGCCDSLPRKERAGRKAHGQLGLSVCIGMRARPFRSSVASREREKDLEDFAVWLAPFSLLEMAFFLPPSAFSCFFPPFFSLDTSGLDFVFSALLQVRRWAFRPLCQEHCLCWF